MPGIHTGHVQYLPSHNNFFGVLNLVHREFRQVLGVLGVGSSGKHRELRRLACTANFVTVGAMQAIPISDVSGFSTARKRLVFEWGL